MNYKDYIANVPNFPCDGVLFRDITPLLQDAKAFSAACEELAADAKNLGTDVIVGPEARGFIFGGPVATKLGVGFVPVRKPNKLPREQISFSYSLEYGTNTLCMHKDAIKPGQKVFIVDDLLATGGTIEAAIKLVESLGGIVCGIGFVIELCDLKGRDLLSGYHVVSLIKY